MDGGVSYPDTLASGDFDSTWVWEVPDTNESDCRIKAVCMDAASNEASDESDADFEIIGRASVPGVEDMPNGVVLFQNRPSPFESSTEIKFGIPKPGKVGLRVYSVAGRLVATLADGPLPAGYHIVVWRGRDDQGNDVADGVYFCRLTTQGKSLTRKMLLLR